MFGFLRWEGLRVNLDEPWFNANEMALFTKARKGGVISVFRASKCAGCKREIPKIDSAGKLLKTHCSKKCYDETTKEKAHGGDEG